MGNIWSFGIMNVLKFLSFKEKCSLTNSTQHVSTTHYLITLNCRCPISLKSPFVLLCKHEHTILFLTLYIHFSNFPISRNEKNTQETWYYIKDCLISYYCIWMRIASCCRRFCYYPDFNEIFKVLCTLQWRGCRANHSLW